MPEPKKDGREELDDRNGLPLQADDEAPTAALLAGIRPAGGAGPSFSVGELAAGRFRILRFIAQGGMGEVYEAEDLELGERIALKTIRPDIAASEGMLGRFRQEVQLSRKVTHPNVCRIFDVFRHQRPSPHPSLGPGPSVAFLTMELLGGETLADRLRRGGRLSVEEALPIVEQMAAALDAAHRVGVVHRDFKSGNVGLDRVADGSLRVVVTDFGLAGAVDSSRADDVRALALGTPAYMAPEQVSGEDTRQAADVYALGVVIYEMVTGTVPFVSDTAAKTAALRLTEPPPPPHLHSPGLDPRWEAAILRCLARDPGQRFGSALEVAAALREEKAPGEGGGRMSALSSWLGIAALVAVVAGVGMLILRPETGGPGPLRSLQLTTSAGLDLYPSFSPDGQTLVFSSNRSGTFEIYLRDVVPGASDVPLTGDGAQNLQPVFSPDGARIVYHSRGQGGLWTVPVSGGKPGRLTPFGSHPAWSPDGRTIAFQSHGLDVIAANSSPAMAPSTLWLVPSEGGAARPLTRVGEPPGGHGSPAWAPDGGRIAFGSYSRRASSIWSIRPDGGGLSRVLEGLRVVDPAFSADGSGVMYSAIQESGDYGLWWVSVSPSDGKARGEAHRIASGSVGTARHLATSRDGRRLAFSALAMASNLWSLRLSGAGEAPDPPSPLTRETGRNTRPAFSPDGRLLAFERWQSGANPDVWVMEAEGGHARPLTTQAAVDGVPTWFPDGRRVAFFSEREGRRAVWSVDVATREEKPLLPSGQDLEFPRLSPDGRRVAFASKEGATLNVWIADLEGGSPNAITFDRESVSYACWSPDGRWLAAQMRRGEDSQVVVLPAQGGKLEQLTDEPGQSWAYSWSPDGDKIAFAAFREGFWNVWWVSRSTRERRQLTRYQKPDAYVRYPAWSPRGDRLVYEYAETTGNIWILEAEERSGGG